MVTWLNVKFCWLLGVSFHSKEVLRNLKIQKFAKIWLQNGCIEMLLCHKNQPSAMHLCGQYILADRFLRNSGYLVEREVLSTFRCQFLSKRSFEKSKNTENRHDFQMAALRCFFAIKINLVQCIPCGQYILADRFLRNSGYLVEREVLSTFGCQFSSK